MATILSSANVQGQVSWNASSGTIPDVIVNQAIVAAGANLSIGSAAGQVNCYLASAASVPNGSPLVVDVFSGSSDPLNNAVAMLHVMGVFVVSTVITAGNNVVVGAGTSPILGTDQFTVQANTNGYGCFGQVWNTAPGYAKGASALNLTFTCASGTWTGYYVIFGSAS